MQRIIILTIKYLHCEGTKNFVRVVMCCRRRFCGASDKRSGMWAYKYLGVGVNDTKIGYGVVRERRHFIALASYTCCYCKLKRVRSDCTPYRVIRYSSLSLKECIHFMSCAIQLCDGETLIGMSSCGMLNYSKLGIYSNGTT